SATRRPWSAPAASATNRGGQSVSSAASRKPGSLGIATAPRESSGSETKPSRLSQRGRGTAPGASALSLAASTAKPVRIAARPRGGAPGRERHRGGRHRGGAAGGHEPRHERGPAGGARGYAVGASHVAPGLAAPRGERGLRGRDHAARHAGQAHGERFGHRQ